MTLQELFEKEKKIKKYNYLLNKFFNGISLEKRTKIEGTLLDACWGQESINFYGEFYCKLSIYSGVNCKYLLFDSKDKNCREMGYMKCGFIDKIKKETNSNIIITDLKSNYLH